MACKLSAMRIAVTKMHGARNDFVVIDRRRKKNGNLPSFARWACDRHAGIGADGVISIESSGLGDARMRIFNADGSEAEMCGNGIRCAARWLDEVEAREGLTFETDAGLIATQIVSRGREYAVRVSMGRPQIDEIFVSAWEVRRSSSSAILTSSSFGTASTISTSRSPGRSCSEIPPFPTGPMSTSPHPAKTGS